MKFSRKGLLVFYWCLYNNTRYLYSRGPVRQVCLVLLLLTNHFAGFPAPFLFRFAYFCHAFPVNKYPSNKIYVLCSYIAPIFAFEQQKCTLDGSPQKPSFFSSVLFCSLQEAEVTLYLQSARLVLGGAAMQGGRIEEAMELFEQVKTSRGMFNLAQVQFREI